MFPRRYFPGRMFAPRFFPESAGEAPAAATSISATWDSPTATATWSTATAAVTWASPASAVTWDD